MCRPDGIIQLIPYGLLASDHFLNQPARAISPNPATPPGLWTDQGINSSIRAGLDAKFVAKDSLDLRVTLNRISARWNRTTRRFTINQRLRLFFPRTAVLS